MLCARVLTLLLAFALMLPGYIFAGRNSSDEGFF